MFKASPENRSRADSLYRLSHRPWVCNLANPALPKADSRPTDVRAAT